MAPKAPNIKLLLAGALYHQPALPNVKTYILPRVKMSKSDGEKKKNVKMSNFQNFTFGKKLPKVKKSKCRFSTQIGSFLTWLWPGLPKGPQTHPQTLVKTKPEVSKTQTTPNPPPKGPKTGHFRSFLARPKNHPNLGHTDPILGGFLTLSEGQFDPIR